MRSLLLLASLLFLTSTVSAQERGVLAGIVHHFQSREPIGGAVVTIAAIGRTDTTDAAGVFLFRDMPYGSYAVAIAAGGYEASEEQLEVTIDSGAWKVELAPVMESAGKELVISAMSEHRSIVEGCCRVESLNEEIERSAPIAPSATEALSRYATCTPMQSFSAIDQSGSIRLRGGHPAYMLPLVEGLPMIGGMSQLYRMQQLPSLAIQNITIIEGSSAAEYGNRAVIGVLDIDLKEPTTTHQFQLTAGTAIGGGEAFTEVFPDRNIAGSYTGSLGGVGLAAFASLNSHSLVVDDGSIYSNHPQWDRWSGYAKAVVSTSEASALTLGVLSINEERRGVIFMDHLTVGPASVKGTPSKPLHNSGSPGYAESINTAAFNGFAKFRVETGENSELLISSLFGRTEQDSYYDQTYLHGIEKILFGKARYSTISGDHSVQAGIEYTNESLTTPGVDTCNLTMASYAFTIPAVFAQDQISLGDAWDVLLGARYDLHSLEQGSSGVETTTGIISPRAAIQWQPSGVWRIRLMSGFGYKGESLFTEDSRVLHGNYRYVPSNDLKVQRSWTNNLEVTYTYLFGEIAGEANFNFFQTRINDKSVVLPGSTGLIRFTNSAKPAVLQGFEFQTRPSLSEHFTLGVAVSLNDYQIPDSTGTYQRVELSPGLNADLSLLWQDRASGWAAETWNSFIGSVKLYENPYRDASPAYLLTNFRIEKQVGDFRIHLAAMNLLDVQQDDTMPAVYLHNKQLVTTNIWAPLEGREFFAGLVWQF